MDPKDIQLIDAARRQFDAISERARIEIYRKVLEHYQKHPGSPWSGAPLRDLEMMIRQFYADLGVQYDKAFRETLPPTMQKFYDRAVEEIQTAGVRNAILGQPDSGRVKYFLDSAFDQVAMKTENMTFQHIKALRTITADVTRQMSITGATRREVSKALLDRAMELPGFQFIDKAGNNWSLKSYFNTLARTELMNAARASYDDKVTEEGFDVMKLTTSGHCCDKCARFEGRLFSLTGATPGLPSKQDLLDAGVFHPNCTHSYSLMPDYIRERDYNEDGSRKQAGNLRSFLRSFNPEPEDSTKRFDGNFTSEAARSFDKQLRQSKLTNAQIDEFNAHMQATEHLLKRPPNVELLTEKELANGVGAHTDVVTWKMFVQRGADSWNGCRNTIAHEWGEMLFDNLITGTERQVFQRIVAKDALLALRDPLLKNSRWDDFNPLTTELSRSIFGKNFTSLTVNEQHRIIGFFDFAGSATGGEIGFGHDQYEKELIADRFGNDSFAGMYVAVVRGYPEYREKFPNTWRYIEALLKK